MVSDGRGNRVGPLKPLRRVRDAVARPSGILAGVTRIRRQTLVPALSLALALGLAFAVTLGAARRPEAALREAAGEYARALAAGDAAAAAARRADRDPGPEGGRARALKGDHWAVREIQVDESGDEARVTLLWVGEAGGQRAESQLWVLDAEGRWAFVALAR